MATASSTPLSRKLGIQTGHRVALVGCEDGLPALEDGWPAGARRLAVPAAPMDVIVLFAPTAMALTAFDALAELLTPAGALWVAWPKKASRRPTDLDFARVQAYGLDHGRVDNKKCAIDATWSGLRFVRRRADRPGARMTDKKKGTR